MNRGLLNLPLSISEGITAVILLLVLPTMEKHPVIQFLMTWVIVFVMLCKTGVLMDLVVCIVLLFSHVDWLLQSVVIFLSFLGIRELYRAVKLDGTKGIVFLSLTLAVTLAFLPSSGYLDVISVFFPVYVILCLSLMLLVNRLEGVTVFYSVAMGVCIALFFRAAAELRSMERGFCLLTAPILTCAVTDVAAYFAGRRFGKRRLAPKISPKKTVAGFVGGTAAAVLVLLLAALILDAAGILQVRLGTLTAYLALTSIIGQFGDLALRLNGKKDTSLALRAVFGLCFSIALSAVWERFEYGVDCFFAADMQHDTVVTAINSHYLSDTAGGLHSIRSIREVTLNGVPLEVGGYLDIGLIDTMQDILVETCGALVYFVWQMIDKDRHPLLY